MNVRSSSDENKMQNKWYNVTRCDHGRVLGDLIFTIWMEKHSQNELWNVSANWWKIFEWWHIKRQEKVGFFRFSSGYLGICCTFYNLIYCWVSKFRFVNQKASNSINISSSLFIVCQLHNDFSDIGIPIRAATKNIMKPMQITMKLLNKIEHMTWSEMDSECLVWLQRQNWHFQRNGSEKLELRMQFYLFIIE